MSSGGGQSGRQRSEGMPPPGDVCAAWLQGDGEACDVVISSRVRVARNLAGYPFPHRASKEVRREVLLACRDAVTSSVLDGECRWTDLHTATGLSRTLLVERHVISKQLAKGRHGAEGAAAEDPRGVGARLADERIAVMANEEDHLRIQVMRAGLALDEAWRDADRADDALESKLDYAYSPRFGYLTTCPTNVGTGVRMSVMLHLPGLKLTGDIEKVKRAATDMNLAVRGFYGEGSEAVGDLYQLSNQTTLGRSEQMILADLQGDIIPRVIEYERVSRRTLQAKRAAALDDQVFRSLGTLASARLMSAEEAMTCISHVRLGVVIGLVKGLDLAAVNRMFLNVQPGHLQVHAGREMDQEARKHARADMLRAAVGPAFQQR
jgi:protein arginine kinase